MKKKVAFVLETVATGDVFKKTVMMAELPLSVAALKNDKNIFRQLLQYGAKLDGQNSHEDNVCHSLIKYAYLYPDKLQDVLSMLKYIINDKASGFDREKNQKLRKKVWFVRNKEDLSPLHLAAKFGQHEIFKFIMEIDGYRSQNTSDGLFDIKEYDVTEIDAISFVDPEETGVDKYQRRDRTESTPENVSKHSVETEKKTEKNISILRRMLQLDPGCAFKFIVFTPVGRIIDEKWKRYKWFFVIWFILHFVYMSILTYYATHRSLQKKNTNSTYDVSLEPNFVYPILGDSFSLAFGIINILVGLSLLLDALCRCLLGRMRVRCLSFKNPYSNATFRLLFFVFGLSLILDFICAVFVPLYENYLLILAVCIGWFLMLFFLRVCPLFSYFTVMIQNVLIRDLLPFSVVILFELICFSTAMFMAVQGAADVDPEYNNYGRVLLSMFKLTVGLGDVGLLYQTRHPALAILILIIFIILTTLLMFNSLIAMISRTSTELAEEAEFTGARKMHMQLQRLSVILYIESILHFKCVYLGGNKKEQQWYSNRSKKRQSMQRRYLKIESLLKVDNTTTDVDEQDKYLNKRFDIFSNYLDNLKRIDEKVEHADNLAGKGKQTKKMKKQQKKILGTVDQLHWSSQPSRSLQASLEICHRQLCNNCDEINSLGDGPKD